MSNVGIVDAFRRYGAKQVNPQWAVTAIAEDGSLVVSCWSKYFSRPSQGLMRYEDRLSRWKRNALGQTSPDAISNRRYGTVFPCG